MTATMKKPQQTKIEVAEPKLRFKITNQKAKYFPDALTETDYHKLKIGDIVTVGTNYNSLYEVIDIWRATVTEYELNHWNSRIAHSYSNITGSTREILYKDNDLKKLLDKYKESGNFGVCQIKIKTILRGNNIARRTSTKILFEPETTRHINYNNVLTRVSIADMILRKQTQADHAVAVADRATKKRDLLLHSKGVLEALEARRNPKPIVLEDTHIIPLIVSTATGFENFDTNLLL